MQALDLNVFAIDGLALETIQTQKTVELEPGYRADVLVKMTGKRGDTFYVVKKALGADRALRKIAETQKVLARIDVVEEGPDLKLPAADAVKRFAHKHIDRKVGPRSQARL